jgi:chromosome partitioning protein
MIVATVNSKGGVGKSTLAAHLAAWFYEQGKKVVLVDSDRQASSSSWLSEAEPGIKAVQAKTADEIYRLLPELYEDCDVLIADGPAGLEEQSRILLMFADVAIVPCGASRLDTDATGDAVKLIEQARVQRKFSGTQGGLPQGLFVINKLQPHTVLGRELEEHAQEIGIPVACHALHLRQVYADAPGQRSFVWRMGKRAEVAAEEINALFQEVTRYAEKAVNSAEA